LKQFVETIVKRFSDFIFFLICLTLDYVAWSREWPIKTAAYKAVAQKGKSNKRTITRNSALWNVAHDEKVDSIVLDFFNEGG
jgi:hypothetical protein